MSSDILITVSGRVGAGKSALMVELADLLKRHTSLTVEFAEPEKVQQEFNSTAMETSEERQEYLHKVCGNPKVIFKEVITP